MILILLSRYYLDVDAIHRGDSKYLLVKLDDGDGDLLQDFELDRGKIKESKAI